MSEVHLHPIPVFEASVQVQSLDNKRLTLQCNFSTNNPNLKIQRSKMVRIATPKGFNVH